MGPFGNLTFKKSLPFGVPFVWIEPQNHIRPAFCQSSSCVGQALLASCDRHSRFGEEHAVFLNLEGAVAFNWRRQSVSASFQLTHNAAAKTDTGIPIGSTRAMEKPLLQATDGDANPTFRPGTSACHPARASKYKMSIRRATVNQPAVLRSNLCFRYSRVESYFELMPLSCQCFKIYLSLFSAVSATGIHK